MSAVSSKIWRNVSCYQGISSDSISWQRRRDTKCIRTRFIWNSHTWDLAVTLRGCGRHLILIATTSGPPFKSDDSGTRDFDESLRIAWAILTSSGSNNIGSGSSSSTRVGEGGRCAPAKVCLTKSVNCISKKATFIPNNVPSVFDLVRREGRRRRNRSRATLTTRALRFGSIRRFLGQLFKIIIEVFRE